MSRETIIDTTKPSAGRIYDYLLGGHHNFEIDRQAARKLTELFQFLPKAFRLQRWCLQDIAEELTQQRGYSVIIDFASGLPTQDHIHYVVPEGTIVIYSDFDPVTVEYARNIIEDTPNVYYFEADAGEPEKLLERPDVQKILNGRKDVAFVYWGVSGFLTDEELAHASNYLYQWADDSSVLAFQAQAADGDANSPEVQRLFKLYEQTGSKLHGRSLEAYQALLEPWHPDDKGFMSLLEWHGFDQTEMSDVERRAFGSGGPGYGAFLVK